MKATPCTYSAAGLHSNAQAAAASAAVLPCGVNAHTGLAPILRSSFTHMISTDERIPSEHAAMIRQAIEAYAKLTLDAVAAANGEAPIGDWGLSPPTNANGTASGGNGAVAASGSAAGHCMANVQYALQGAGPGACLVPTGNSAIA